MEENEGKETQAGESFRIEWRWYSLLDLLYKMNGP